MKKILLIAKKELLEIIRDKGTLFILLLPVFIFPLFNFGMDYINKDSVTEMSVSVKSNNSKGDKIFNEYINQNTKYNITKVSAINPIDLLNDGKVQCVVEINSRNISFIYNSSSYSSMSLAAKLGEDFEKFYHKSVNAKNDIYNLILKDENNCLANTTNSMANIFVPIILIMLVFQGTTNFANDFFAGEKERKTLELLLLSNAKRSEIYFGKAFALLLISLINLTISLISYFISFGFTKNGMNQFKFIIYGIPVLNITIIILMLTILSIVSVTLSLFISIIAKNMKNSQMLNEIVLAVPVGITLITTLNSIQTNSAYLSYIPIFNTIICFNKAFSGNVDISSIFVTIISNIFLISVIIYFSLRYIESEKIIK